jgi:iron-sulfur cluster assembly protein
MLVLFPPPQKTRKPPPPDWRGNCYDGYRRYGTGGISVLEVTKRAADAIRNVVAQAGAGVIGLRISVSVGECSGIRYHMSFDTSADESDEILDCGDAKLLIDTDSHRLLEGVTIDFKDDPPEAGFVFDNPAASDLCSCANGSCSESEGLQ